MNDKYLQYGLEDFLNDDSFIAYVKNENSKDVSMWKNILAKYPQLTSKSGEAKQIIVALKFKNNSPDEKQIERIWGNIKSGIDISKIEQKQLSKRIYKIALSVAASIILILLVTKILNNSTTTVTTPNAEITTITLPDNSTIKLNVDSKVNYNKDAWNQNRKIELSGEAFFNVKKGQKFVVETPISFIEVLGTSFNVYDRGKELNVRCYSGKVRVINKISGDTVVLTPGLGAIGNRNSKIDTYSFDIDKKNIWKDKIITFDTRKMSFVFTEIERVFNVKIHAGINILNRKFTGKVVINNIDETLESVCWPMHLTYKIVENKVVITEQKK